MIAEGSGGGETKWSAETIRRRGVHAMVDALRLSKEHRQLSFQLADQLAENRNLRVYLQHLRALNESLRVFIQQHNGHGAFAQKTGNSWNQVRVLDGANGTPGSGEKYRDDLIAEISPAAKCLRRHACTAREIKVGTTDLTGVISL